MNYIDPSGHRAKDKNSVTVRGPWDFNYVTGETILDPEEFKIPNGTSDMLNFDDDEEKLAKLISQGKKKLEELIAKAQKFSDSAVEKCGAFNSGWKAGQEAAMDMLDNWFIGNKMHAIGLDIIHHQMNCVKYICPVLKE